MSRLAPPLSVFGGSPWRDAALIASSLAATGLSYESVGLMGQWGVALPVLVATTMAVHSQLAMGRWRAVTQTLATAAVLWVMGAGAAIAVAVLVTGVVSSHLMTGTPRRSAVLRAGAWASAAAGGSTALAALVLGAPPADHVVLAAAAAGLLSPSLALAIGPALETTFGHVTRLTMSEWLSYDHPLLRELAATAPGTFQHSVNVGILADAAATAVGGDAFLARLGGVYHDIGKIRAPTYFIENQSGANPHDDLAPWESAQILRAHVLDGVAMVRAQGMGERIADFIREHHGTGVMRVFRDKAAFGPQPDGITESYQYPGPAPRSRETGIVMIADQIEATARSAPPADAAACDELVRRTINRVEGQGELHASRLSATNLAAIQVAVSRALHAMYHRRQLAYPIERPARPRLVSRWFGDRRSTG